MHAIGLGMATGLVAGLLLAVIPNNVNINGSLRKYQRKRAKILRNLNGARLDKVDEAIANF